MNGENTSCGCCQKKEQWRRDFPIEWEGDQYVTRREMVKFLTLGSLLLAVANWTAVVTNRFLRRGIKATKWIGAVSSLRQNGSLLFRYPTDQDPCIAVRTSTGELVAYSQVCTHLSCAVVYDEKEQNLFCPCHNGRFDLQRGAPLAGPPTRPLPKIKIEERFGQIYAVEREG
jgi:arsenite oxidase small subunit